MSSDAFWVSLSDACRRPQIVYKISTNHPAARWISRFTTNFFAACKPYSCYHAYF